ncbi:hypothetical protein LCGC14_0225300 [marine sediment metagenome]|uniref:Uncharacterized protein n=1 Tax=marine sediment metagenome TaxID=412755 RepID=A0A0F9WX25_9ZZZZ
MIIMVMIIVDKLNLKRHSFLCHGISISDISHRMSISDVKIKNIGE